MSKNDSWKEDRFVKRWLTGLKGKTPTNYMERFPHWLDFIGMTPEEQIKKRMHDLTSEDITERQYFEDKYREYKTYLENKGTLKGRSVTTELTPVSSFFTRNGLRLALRRGDWKANVTQEPIKRDKITIDDIKRMYSHANLRDKALLLVLAQSGFSEIDVSEFKIEHFPELWSLPETEHYFIEKGREKSTHTQATCISYEALHDIKEMLIERGKPTEGFLFVSQTKGKGSKIDTRTIREAIKALAIRTFGEEKGKKIQAKGLRSFYNSVLLHTKPPLTQEIKDLMMGHERQGARKHYDYDEETIKEAYINAFENLSINGIQNREDMKKLKDDMNMLIGKQQVQIEEQKNDLKDAVERFEERLDAKSEEIKKEIMDKFELFKLVTTKEDWEIINEAIQRIKLNKLNQTEAETEEADEEARDRALG